MAKHSFPKTSLAIAIATTLGGSPALLYAQQQDKQEKAIEVIEVSAQKRSQNIMDVPLSVDAFSAKDLENTGSVALADMDNYIPGFEMSNGETQPSMTIRGVNSPNISTGGDPSVASFFDDVYMPRAAMNVLFSDIARVEVLKGPQGTLFGRNAAAGVVSIIPNAPSDEFEGFIKARVGNYDLRRYETMVNIPVADNFFIRANALFNERGGIAENTASSHRDLDAGAKNNMAARLSMLWNVNDSTNVQLSYDYGDLDQAPPEAIGVSQYAPNSFMAAEGIYVADPFTGKYQNDVVSGEETREMEAVTFKLNHEFNEHWSMKYVASYREWITDNREDEDGTALIDRYFVTNNHEDSNIFYSELQFNYNSDRINYVGGITYSKEEVAQTSDLQVYTDTIATIAAGEINALFSSQVAAAIQASPDFQGALQIANGDMNAAAKLAGFSDFNTMVSAQKSALGIQDMTNIWNLDEMAGLMTLLATNPALGLQDDAQALVNQINAQVPDAVAPTLADKLKLMQQASPDALNQVYDAIALNVAGNPGIFGPGGHQGNLWNESMNNTGDFTNIGIYSDVDFRINDKWSVIFGVRYSEDTKEFGWHVPKADYLVNRPGLGVSMSQSDLANGALVFTSDRADAFPSDIPGTPIKGYVESKNLLFGELPSYSVEETWRKATGRFVTQYRPDDNSMIYVTYSTGYKSGGYDSLAPVYLDCEFNTMSKFCASQQSVEPYLAAGYGFQSPFEPEESTNFEIGYKADLLDGDLRLQTAFYELEIDNRQRTVTTLNSDDAGGIAKPRVINGNEKIKGMELILDYHLTSDLSLGFVTEYRNTRADWEDFFNAQGELVDGVSSVGGDDTYTLMLDWQPEFAGGFLNVHIDYYYRENTNDRNIDKLGFEDYIPGYLSDTKLLNSRIAWTNQDENIEIALWGKNLLDNRYISDVSNITTQQLGTPYVRLIDPLTWGVEFKYAF